MYAMHAWTGSMFGKANLPDTNRYFRQRAHTNTHYSADVLMCVCGRGGGELDIMCRWFLAARFESGLRKINKMVVKYSVASHVLAFPNLRTGTWVCVLYFVIW